MYTLHIYKVIRLKKKKRHSNKIFFHIMDPSEGGGGAPAISTYFSALRMEV